MGLKLSIPYARFHLKMNVVSCEHVYDLERKVSNLRWDGRRGGCGGILSIGH
jgi:hypothetical protein